VKRLGVALLAGSLVAFSLPPWGWWPLSFVGVALLEIAAGPEPSRRARFARGAAFGLAWTAIGMAWMSQLTVPGYIVAGLIYATAHGLAELASPNGRWRVIGRPAAHSLVEALRFSFPFGGVPLASLGIAQADGPLVGIARVGGVILLTWVVFQVGFAAGAIISDARRGERDLVPAVSASAVAVAVLALSFVAPQASGTGTFLDVAAVQGGGEQGTRALDVPSRVVFERHLEATRTIQPDPDLDLVVWPENVIDVVDFETSEELRLVAAEAARLDVPFAVGITEDVPGQPGRITNAQVVVTPDGQVTSRYDKVRRVPFGEYVPLRGLLDALGAPVDQVPTNAIAGTGPAVLDLPDGTRMAVAISWEVFFGGRVRDGVKHGGAFVLNPTNGASYTGTILQTQQVASSRLRAIETGRWLVQVSPTGFSEIVTPDGDVIDRTAVSERAIVRGTVELRTGRTWYVRAGDAPFIVALLVVFAGAWIATLSRGRRRPSEFEQDGDGAVVDQRDLHLGAEPAGRDGGAEPAQPGDEGDDERLGVFRAGGGDPARAAALGRVAVERELADDE
jgi:apolipoprotein N-acyltransferase